jgi:hypothetical protein
VGGREGHAHRVNGACGCPHAFLTYRTRAVAAFPRPVPPCCSPRLPAFPPLQHRSQAKLGRGWERIAPELSQAVTSETGGPYTPTYAWAPVNVAAALSAASAGSAPGAGGGALFTGSSSAAPSSPSAPAAPASTSASPPSAGGGGGYFDNAPTLPPNSAAGALFTGSAETGGVASSDAGFSGVNFGQ